eukprot:1205508-Rhodomonas_salina.1
MLLLYAAMLMLYAAMLLMYDAVVCCYAVNAAMPLLYGPMLNQYWPSALYYARREGVRYGPILSPYARATRCPVLTYRIAVG